LYSELLDQSDRNVITIGEITNTEHIAFLKQIRDEIEKEKESILGRLAHVELDDKRLNEFFEMAKDASVGLIDQ
jgi:nanoRNase/pAp phosphatase (c-di-AMP/oligoRNAs hydrolase)